MQNNGGAENNLGILYQNGRGVPQNYALAAHWFRAAAADGVAGADKNLGIATFLAKQFKEAAAWQRPDKTR